MGTNGGASSAGFQSCVFPSLTDLQLSSMRELIVLQSTWPSRPKVSLPRASLLLSPVDSSVQVLLRDALANFCCAWILISGTLAPWHPGWHPGTLAPGLGRYCCFASPKFQVQTPNRARLQSPLAALNFMLLPPAPPTGCTLTSDTCPIHTLTHLTRPITPSSRR